MTFRDPSPVESEARELRLAIAGRLVRARSLPADVPVIDGKLLDVAADKRGVSLVFGHEDPVFAVRYAKRKRKKAGLVSLGRGDLPSLEVQPIAPELGQRHQQAADAIRDRLERALTSETWGEVERISQRLASLPIGVPMTHYRQHVAGSDRGLVRTGFRCNQNCGLCWQDRQWPGYDRQQILTWIEDLRAAGCEHLILSGGEPTIDPGFFEYLELGWSLGFRTIEIETNAIQMGKNGLAEKVAALGPAEAFVSLHSCDPETSDLITRAPGTFHPTVRGIKALLAAGLRVHLNAVLVEQGLSTIHELPDFVHREFGAYEGLEGLCISGIQHPWDPTLERELTPNPVRVREVLPKVIERAHAVGLSLAGITGPCGPQLCAHGADPRVADLKPISESLDWRMYLGACEGCKVKSACFGVRRSDVDLFGDDCVVPIR